MDENEYVDFVEAGAPNEIIKEVLCRSYRINKAVMSAMQSYSDQAGKK